MMKNKYRLGETVIYTGRRDSGEVVGLLLENVEEPLYFVKIGYYEESEIICCNEDNLIEYNKYWFDKVDEDERND